MKNHKSKKKISFKVISVVKFAIDMVGFDKISSDVKWIQKGIEIIEKRFPSVIRYISKQSALSKIDKCKIILLCSKDTKESTLKKIFIFWVEKELTKRIIFIVLESLIIPFTPFLALLPGPNVFFYVPALFLYYHYKSFRGLKRLDFTEMDFEVEYIEE